MKASKNVFFIFVKKNMAWSKVAAVQNWSGFFSSFIYIWFDRAWWADHKSINFILIRSIFSWEKPWILRMTANVVFASMYSFFFRNYQISRFILLNLLKILYSKSTEKTKSENDISLDLKLRKTLWKVLRYRWAQRGL